MPKQARLKSRNKTATQKRTHATEYCCKRPKSDHDGCQASHAYTEPRAREPSHVWTGVPSGSLLAMFIGRKKPIHKEQRKTAKQTSGEKETTT
jgi:hypothetical protein